jgi:diguanylate cyclase (GGDEF)-like protein
MSPQPQPESIAEISDTPRPGGARLVRIRLTLALIAAAFLPLAIVVPIVRVVTENTQAAMRVPALAALGVIAVTVIGLIVWMAKQVVRPAEAMEASFDSLRMLYDAEREASLLDHLTGLGNHRAFYEQLERQLARATRYRGPLSLVLIDLDELKHVNDTLGHAIGDALLAEVGRVVRAVVRVADSGFRTGGDEFALILPATDADGAEELTRRLLRRTLDDRPGSRYAKPISFSAGIASVPLHATEMTKLVARADAALYRGKRNGRTAVTIFDETVDRPVLSDHERAELSERILRLIDRRALQVVYQPIVDLKLGRALAVEALVRPAADAGFDSPSALFAAAELTGHITDLDRACLETVVADARRIPEELFLSLNISPRTFEAPEFSAAAFLKILQRNGMAPGRIVLELTEREAIQNMDRLGVALQACRAAGVRIAADDVGAGNAGLRLLSQFKFDVMKIDLSLIQVGSGREPVTGVVRSLVELARRWQALVIAEGIETGEQLQIVRDLGIDAGQGYLLGRPGPLQLVGELDMEHLGSSAGQPWWGRRAGPRPLVKAM